LNAGTLVGNIQVQYIVDSMMTRKSLMLAIEAIRPSKLALFLSQDAHKVVMERMEKRFDEQGDDASGKWASLSEATTRFREAAGFGGEGPINVRTGQLRAWLQDVGSETILDGGGAMFTFPGTAPYDTVTAEKFKTAQGGKSKPKTVARPVLALGAADILEIQAHLSVFLKAFGDGSRT
jgi:hypothetical protein